jgi:hypothetical protein
VPGCTGNAKKSYKTDFCIVDPDIANAATYPPTFAPTYAPTYAPTDAPTYSLSYAPTTAPTDAPDGERVRDPMATLALVGQDGEPAASYPLKLCEGDCDSDDDVSIFVCQSEAVVICLLILPTLISTLYTVRGRPDLLFSK